MSQLPPTVLPPWPRQPFVGLALAAGLGILGADRAPNCSWPAWSIVAALLPLALVRRNSLWTYAFVAAGFFLLHSLRTTDTPGQRLARELGGEAETISTRGTVISEPKFSASGYATFLLRLSVIERAGEIRPAKATLFVRWKGVADFGDELQLLGIARPIAPPRNPGEFDMRAYLARRDVYDQLFVGYEGDGTLVRRRGGNWILRAAQKSRRWMQEALVRGLDDAPDVRALISGMVLGLRHQTPEDIEEPFQQTGTLHLFAVAGLHVGIVAQLLWIVATVARLPRKWAIALIIPALFFYAAITGLHPSSVRAAVMSAVLLGGFVVERRVFAVNSLAAAAVLILCWNTNELFSIGFQLSFAVVTAIVLFADPIFRRLRFLFEPDPFLPRSLLSQTRRFTDRFFWWLGRGASVSLAAWIGSLPLMLWYYHIVTPISLLANLVVVPVAFFILAGGLLSMIAAPISSWLGVVFNNANWISAQIVLSIVHFFAQWPTGHFYAERPHCPSGARAEITVLDLGAGGAAHVRTRDGDWLFDTGGQRDFERIVRGYLRSRGVNRLDGVLLSHGDSGHIGGAAGLLHDFQPRTIIDNPAPDRSRIHRALIDQLAEQRRNRTLRAAGDTLILSPGVTARILFPPTGFAAKTADDQTLVVQLLIAGKPRALFMFDSGEATERALLARHLDLRSDIIVKGQHRSGISGRPDFLDAVRPQAIVATSRDFPNSEHITDEWAETLRARGIKLFRQDKTGAIQFQFFRDDWKATAYLTSETFRSTNR